LNNLRQLPGYRIGNIQDDIRTCQLFKGVALKVMNLVPNMISDSWLINYFPCPITFIHPKDAAEYDSKDERNYSHLDME
jgi:hypothetical protein